MNDPSGNTETLKHSIDNKNRRKISIKLTFVPKTPEKQLNFTSKFFLISCSFLRKVWRYQRGDQNPYIEEEQTTQWPKEKGQTTIYKTYT